MILDAARAEFAAKGYDQTSLRGIARAADVDPALVHHYFDGKPALFGRAFTRAAGGDVIQVIPPVTPCYCCHVAGRVVAEEVSSARDMARVAYADLPRDKECPVCSHG